MKTMEKSLFKEDLEKRSQDDHDHKDDDDSIFFPSPGYEMYRFMMILMVLTTSGSMIAPMAVCKRMRMKSWICKCLRGLCHISFTVH
uniref:Uncharacterized protein n=1 Tax=Lepeophtheirus salmonis TaxID=72036 RepID=A0A0K2UH49_LEPSM